MNTAKQQVRRLLDQLSDDATLEDIQYHVYVCEMIERGLRDLVAGRVISHSEVKERIRKWLPNGTGESRFARKSPDG